MPGDGQWVASRFVSLKHVSPESVDHRERRLAIECPIAIEYNGLGYAVMMATPIDLRDLAIGFTLTERLVSSRADIIDVDTVEVEQGIILRITLSSPSFAPLAERVRHRVSESGCGLCGVENLEQALRPLPLLGRCPRVARASVFRSLAAIEAKQHLNQDTGAVHAAAFCSPDGSVHLVREDLGRHNALDKLIGAMGDADPASGFVLVTSRCSYELVEKTVIAGCPMLVAISAPSSLAVERAKEAGLTLIGLARSDAFLVLHDPHRLFTD